MVFPLVQPVLKINFFVTMWDTPTSSDSDLRAGIAGTIGSAALSIAAPFLAGGFSDVEGLDVESEFESYHPGGDTTSEHRFFKYAKYPKIGLKRGVTFNTDIWDWHHQVITGERKTRKSGTIILLDQHQFFDVPGVVAPFEHFPVAAWTFHNALPLKIVGPTLDAKAESDAIAIEKIELHPDKIERVSLSLIPGVADLNSAVSGLIGAGGGAALGLASAGVSAL